MKAFALSIRNFLIKLFYKGLLKPLFFLRDPEVVHDGMSAVGEVLGKSAVTRMLTRCMFGFSHPQLEQTIAGIHFKNPIGLSAGFDKDARLLDILPGVGFGFEEIGSVTGQPCKGNEKPRLWRLKKSKSLLVYYGLKNDGAEAIASRMKNKKYGFPVGVSIAKTNSQETVPEQAGIADYVKAYDAFVKSNVGDYFTINISCPNAFGGEPFTSPEKFDRLFAALSQIPSDKPVFVKMPAEMPFQTVDDIIQLVRKYRLAGFVCSNLVKSRENEHIQDTNFPQVGGMSGKVGEHLANRQIEYIYKKTRGEFVIIGVGGVFSAADAYKKIKLGASLVQLITGMIFEGPQVVSEINMGLVRLLKSDGYKNISEAIGKGI